MLPDNRFWVRAASFANIIPIVCRAFYIGIAEQYVEIAELDEKGLIVPVRIPV